MSFSFQTFTTTVYGKVDWHHLSTLGMHDYLVALITAFAETENQTQVGIDPTQLRWFLIQVYNHKLNRGQYTVLSTEETSELFNALNSAAKKVPSPSVIALISRMAPAIPTAYQAKRQAFQVWIWGFLWSLLFIEVRGSPIWLLLIYGYDVVSNYHGTYLTFVDPNTDPVSNPFTLVSLIGACILIAFSEFLGLWCLKLMFRSAWAPVEAGEVGLKLFFVVMFFVGFVIFIIIWIFDLYASALTFASGANYAQIGWVVGFVLSISIELGEVYHQAQVKFGKDFLTRPVGNLAKNIKS